MDTSSDDLEKQNMEEKVAADDKSMMEEEVYTHAVIPFILQITYTM